MGILEEHYLANKDAIDLRVAERKAFSAAPAAASGAGHVPVGAFNRYNDPARQPKMSRQHAAEEQRWKDDYNAQVNAYDRQQKAYQTYQDRMDMDVAQGKKELALRGKEMTNMQTMLDMLDAQDWEKRNPAIQKHMAQLEQELGDMETETADFKTRLGEAEAYQADAKSTEEYAHRRITTRDADTVKKELEAAKKAAEQAQPDRDLERGYLQDADYLDYGGISHHHADDLRRQAGDLEAAKKAADQRVADLEDEYRWAQHFEYVDLAKNKDFSALSTYDNSISDPLYRAINGDENAKAELANRHLGSPDGGMALTNLYMAATEGDQETAYMGKDEIAIYNYIYATEGAQAAADYYEFIKTESFNVPSLNTKRRTDIEEQMREYAKDKPFWSSVGTVLASPAKVMTAAGQLADYVSDGELEKDAAYNMFSYAPAAAREQRTADIAEKWGPVGSFAYGLGMSAADFLFNTVLSGGNSTLAGALMATETFADSTLAAKDRGLSDDQAIGLGTVAAMAELVTEKFSVEALLDGVWEKNALQYILKNGLTEGTEEGASSLINLFADILITKDQSEWKLSVAAYESQGMSAEDAFMAALWDHVDQIGLDVVGGWVTGSALSSGRVAGGKTVQSVANKSVDPVADLLDGLVPDAKQNTSPANMAMDEAESTVINTDPAKHTPEEQAVIEEYQNQTDVSLRDMFVAYYENPKKDFSRHTISPVSDRQAADAAELLGGEYSGYVNAINSNGVRHILNDHGPDGEVDHSLGDLNDAARIGYVLGNYDNVELVTYESGELDASAEFRTKDNRPAPMLKYSKKVNGTYYVIEAIPESKYKKFWVVSAYMEKADGGTQAPNANSPGNTPDASLASSQSASNATLSQPGKGVNGNNSQNNQENDLSFLLDNESERFEPDAGDGRQQRFEADLSKYENEYAKKTIQNLLDSGLADNSDEFHSFADWLAKISADKGIVFNLTDTGRLQGTRHDLDGKFVDGFIDENGNITLNIDSQKAGQIIVGHEITHVLEGTKLYKELQSAIKNYAISKIGLDAFNAKLKETEARYKGIGDPDMEITADLIGELLFTDADFIKNLSAQHRNVFQRLWDEIKYLCKVVTAGSKEARQLEKVKKLFEDAYKIDIAENTEIKYTLSHNAKTELHKALYDMQYRNDVQLRDETPAIMLSQKGVKNLPMAMTASHIRENVFTEEEAKKLGLPVTSDIHYHGLGEDFFLKIIDGLDNVKLAYRGTKNASDSSRRENYFLLISEFKDDAGNTINVPVYIDKHAQINRVFVVTNKISTVFGRDSFDKYIKKQIANGDLVRIKNRDTQTSESYALIAQGYGMDVSDGSIPQEQGDVKSSLSISENIYSGNRGLSPLNKYKFLDETSPDNSIRQSKQNSDQEDLSYLSEGIGDPSGNANTVGAMQNPFQNEVVQSKGNTLPFRDAADNVPAASRAGTTHTAIHEDESLYNAKLRLQQDYAGEKAALEQNSAWDHEEVDMAMQIRADLLEEAERTQNWDEFNKWQRIVKDRNSNAGRNLQAWAKHSRHDGQSIIAAASEILENASEKTDKNAVMTEVSALADRFDKAINEKQVGASVDELVEVIRLTARSRNTGFYQNKVMGAIPDKLKPLEWAIYRVAEIARNVDSSVLDKNSLPSNLRFDVGDRIKATDRNNYGNIVANNGDGTYEVYFDNKKTGAHATVTMNADQLRSVRAKKTSVAASNATGSTLSTQAFEQQKANEAYQFLKDMAENGVLNIANDAVPATLGEQVMTARRWSLLSKVATFVRNIGGNILSDVLGSIATNQAVGVDWLLSKKTGTRSVAANHISKAGASGSLDGVAMGILSVALDVDASSGGKYGTGLRTNKMSGGIFSKIASVLEGVQGLALVVPDYAAKGGIEAEYNRGIGRLYDKHLVADDTLAEAGKREAEYRTYTNETALTSAISTIRHTADKANLGVVTKLLPEHKQDGAQKLGLDQIGLGTMAAPFAQVPANVGTMTVDYATGLRGLLQIGKVLSDAKHGNLTAEQQAKAVKNIGKGLTAVELAAAATVLALNGVIKFVGNPAEDDENADEKAFRRGRGETGVQWNASAFNRMMAGNPSQKWEDGDELHSMAWAETLNAYLGFGALMAEDIQNEEATLRGGLMNFANATASSMMDMPLMDTASDAIETARYTQGGPWDKAAAAAGNFGVNTVGSFIPNAIKGVAQGLDPYQRDLYSADTAWGQLGDQFRAVFDRDSLPIKYDSFGRPMMNEEGWSGFANANFRPGYKTTYHTDPMQDELEGLAETYGTTSVYPSRKAPNSITTKDGPVDLNQEQKEAYKQTYGQTEDAVRTALTEYDAYENLSGAGKLKAHEYAKTYAKQTAGIGLDVGYEADDWDEELQGASPEEIISEVFMKTVESLASTKGKELGGGKYDGLAWLLDDGQIGDNEAFLAMSETMQDAYGEYADNGKTFTAEDMIDVYAYAKRDGKTRSDDQLAAATDYIRKTWQNDSKKALALFDAMEAVLTYSIPMQGEVDAKARASYGAEGQQAIYAQMSKSQKEKYVKYVKDTGVTPYQFELALQYKNAEHKKDEVSAYLDLFGFTYAQKQAVLNGLYKQK